MLEGIRRGLPAMHPGEPLRENVIPALDKLRGNGPELWIRLQAAPDLENLRESTAAEPDEIPRLEEVA